MALKTSMKTGMAASPRSKHAPAADADGLGLLTPAATSKRPASTATPATQTQHEEEQQTGEASACIASVIENRAKEARMLYVPLAQDTASLESLFS